MDWSPVVITIIGALTGALCGLGTQLLMFQKQCKNEEKKRNIENEEKLFWRKLEKREALYIEIFSEIDKGYYSHQIELDELYDYLCNKSSEFSLFFSLQTYKAYNNVLQECKAAGEKAMSIDLDVDLRHTPEWHDFTLAIVTCQSSMKNDISPVKECIH